VVRLSPTERRDYVDAISVGCAWRAAGVERKIIAATQKTKLSVAVTIDVYATAGPRKGHLWYEETIMKGILVD
jgi:hypothetical protein